MVADADGAEALWTRLAALDWRGLRVLLPTTPGGRRTLADGLRHAGARVTEIDAYRMDARAPEAIARDWQAAVPDAVLLGSPRTATALIGAVGAEALRALRITIAIGHSTAAALHDAGIPSTIPPSADFSATVAVLDAARGSRETRA
ncbi:MAG: uroporphyrinogen-III synthase [Vicinamibacterales bacterium]